MKLNSLDLCVDAVVRNIKGLFEYFLRIVVILWFNFTIIFEGIKAPLSTSDEPEEG